MVYAAEFIHTNPSADMTILKANRTRVQSDVFKERKEFPVHRLLVRTDKPLAAL